MRPFTFFNSFNRTLQDFIPKDPERKKVNIYSCGPTVYNVAHIGNFRSYVFTDILARSLSLAGYEVKSAMNITDVDDKTIKGVLEQKTEPDLNDLFDYTQPFIKAFFDDIERMNIKPADQYPRATEHIDSMLQLASQLIKKKIAYQKDDSLYFSIEKKQDYGKLSQIDLSQTQTGLRYNTDEYSKEDIRDFVLWKKEKSEHTLAWDSPFGRGRPGWHLECSAMVHTIFADQLDIHTGGIDLIFPHHENEIAQSETAFDAPMSSYWLHCEHLLVNGKKMSKSEGNFYTLQDLIEMGYHPMAFRYLLISVCYRQKINFTLKALKQAEQTLQGIWGTYNRFVGAKLSSSAGLDTDFRQPAGMDNPPGSVLLPDEVDRICGKLEAEFMDHLKDDLNTAKGLAVFHHFLGKVNIWLDALQGELPEKIKSRVQISFDYYNLVLGILEHSKSILAEKGIPQKVFEMLKT